VRLWDKPAEVIEAQRGTLLLWTPFALAIGIGAYFALNFEPSIAVFATVAGVAGFVAAGLRILHRNFAATAAFILLIACGFMLSGFSAHRHGAPVLGFHYYGAVEGRIVALDRSSSNHTRVTLDRLVLERTTPSRTPERVRISLHFPSPFVAPAPGQRVIVTASLSPPQGPIEPDGFNFQRYAWFSGLGAIGYARMPLLEIHAPDTHGWQMAVAALRLRLSAAIRARLAGQKGAFAAAILTGDRSRVDPAVMISLRASNLAHLLAISGLHMGLLTGFVFAIVRYSLALVPPLALRVPGKKIAAVCAFAAASAYLVLSGANIATQRAFVMVAVMLLAVLLDRRALTLRAVAVAAIIVLVIRPESLIEAGFQMSFAATTALVAVFGVLRDWKLLAPGRGKLRSILRWGGSLVVASGVAGLATAPISAYHFNQIAQFGLMANLASVPVMGFVIMPAAVTGILLSPIGIDAPAWWIVGVGIDWILAVAHWISTMDLALRHVAKAQGPVLPLIATGFLALVILRGRVRLIGIAPMLVGFALWHNSVRPDLLMSANGRVLGVMGDQGRALNRDRGNGFIVRGWLKSDGDSADQPTAARRPGLAHSQKVTLLALNGSKIVYRWKKGISAKELSDLCHGNSLVLVPQYRGKSPPGCQVIDNKKLHHLGAVAITGTDLGLVVTGARQRTGARLWSR